MKFHILLIIFLIFSLEQIYGMSYVPVPFEKQLQESDGVVECRYLSHDYKMVGEKIVSVYTFSVEKFIGLSGNEIYNKNNFQIIVPGGVWHGESYKVEGVPRFSKNEELVLLITKAQRGFQLTNLGLGKYFIQTLDRKKVITSSVFNDHPLLGSIDYDEYVRLVNKNFKQRFIGFDQGKNVFLQKESVLVETTNRNPASVENKQQKVAGSMASINIFWILLLFTLLGSVSKLYFKKK